MQILWVLLLLLVTHACSGWAGTLKWSNSSGRPLQQLGSLPTSAVNRPPQWLKGARGLCPPGPFAGTYSRWLFDEDVGGDEAGGVGGVGGARAAGGADWRAATQPCESARQATAGGVWLHTSAFPKDALAAYGVYTNWCFRPLTCSLTPITATLATRCLAGRSLVMLGDSNGRKLAAAMSSFLSGSAKRIAAHSATRCERSAATATGSGYNFTSGNAQLLKHFSLPANSPSNVSVCWLGAWRTVFSVEHGSGPSVDAPPFNETLPLTAMQLALEFVPLIYADDRHNLLTAAGGLVASLAATYWGSVVPQPDFVVANVNTHETARLYAVPPHASGFGAAPSLAHHFDEVSGMPEYPLQLRAMMRTLSRLATRASVWFQSGTVDVQLQPPAYRGLTSNRRLMLMGGWAQAIAAGLGMDVLDSTSLSAQEFPELHSDGVHISGQNSVYYSAQRDIVLSTLCRRDGT